MIYEARPNVTIDIAALCLKTGNAVILRGGSETLRSNLALVEVIQQALQQGTSRRIQEGQTPHVVVLFASQHTSTTPTGAASAGGQPAPAGGGPPTQ